MSNAKTTGHTCAQTTGRELPDDDPHTPVYGKYYALLLEREDVAENFKAALRGILNLMAYYAGDEAAMPVTPEQVRASYVAWHARLGVRERRFIADCFFATADMLNDAGDDIGSLWLELLKEFDLYVASEWE